MPRNSRESINTTFLHVMTQGIEKSFIFNNSDDINFYIKLMYKYHKEYNIRIIAYCIMNNHAHMLLEIKSIKSLSEYMHKLNGAYGKYYNSKYNRVGFVFRDRFKSEGIYNEKHLYNCIHYIHNNPVAAGICKTPEEYPYSNYKKNYFSQIDEIPFIDIDEDKNIFFENIINDFLKKNNLTIDKLKKDKLKLKEIVGLLKNKYNLSYAEIATKLMSNKSTIYRIDNSK